MNFAVISAGKGERLKQEGMEIPKPLIKVNGQTLIERLLKTAEYVKADTFSIILNSSLKETADDLHHKDYPFDVNVIVEDTAGSMESLNELKPFLLNEPTLLTTIDTIFDPLEFKDFVNYAETKIKEDGLWGITNYVDDEKPLYVKVESGENEIIEFSDSKDDHEYVTGGIYYFKPEIFKVLDICKQKNLKRMRDFQREILKIGLNIRAFRFKKIIDIDHRSDIKIAEEFTKKHDIV